MAEQIIHEMEQPAAEGEAAGRTGTPAPMVNRAFRLLDLLSTSEEGMTLSELARALGMSKSSTHGLLKTLESCQAIEQTEDRLYVLGTRIYDLAQRYIQHAGLRRFALPAMRRLAAETGEIVFLGVVEPQGVRIIEWIDDARDSTSLRIAARRGTRIPLLAGAVGKVVLAHESDSWRREFLRTHPLPHYTGQSITDVEQFLAVVEETVRTGIGIDHEEYLVGVNAIAAPVHGLNHTLAASLWIVGFTSHFEDAAMARAAQQLSAEAGSISRSLGAR